MPRRTTRRPSGPEVTEVRFTKAEVKQALIQYAESQVGALPNGQSTIRLNVNLPQETAILEIIHNA